MRSEERGREKSGGNAGKGEKGEGGRSPSLLG